MEIGQESGLIASNETAGRSFELIDIRRVGVLRPLDDEERNLHFPRLFQNAGQGLDQVVLANARGTHKKIGLGDASRLRPRRVQQEIVAENVYRFVLINDLALELPSHRLDTQIGKEQNPLVARKGPRSGLSAPEKLLRHLRLRTLDVKGRGCRWLHHGRGCFRRAFGTREADGPRRKDVRFSQVLEQMLVEAETSRALAEEGDLLVDGESPELISFEKPP